MKTNKLVALVALVLVLTLFGSQMLASSPSLAAPLAADGITATLSQPKSDQPNDQAPTRLTVQGRLTTPGGQPVTTAVNVTFKLYNVPSGGTPLYTEPTVTITPDANGLFTFTDLGTSSGLFSNNFSVPLWVGITVGTDPEMTPRIRLNAAPYALSLAPGAITIGSFDPPGGTGQFGMISSLNNSYNSTAAAGLFGRGRIGVLGDSSDQGTDTNSNSAGSFTNFSNNPGVHTGIIAQALGTGGVGGVFTGTNTAGGTGIVATGRTGIKATASGSGSGNGYGGDFDNNGGSSGFQYGIRALNTSTGGTIGYGGNFFNAGGGSGVQYGIEASNTSTGGTIGYGGSFSNNGGGTADQYGITASNTSTGGSNGYAGFFTNNGGGSGSQFGIRVSTYSTGGTFGYGGDFTNNGGGSSVQRGISVSNNSTGGTTGYGGIFNNNGGGSGQQYGIYATTNSTNTLSSYAGYFSNFASSGSTYGVYSSASSFSGYFLSSPNTLVSVYAVDAVSAQSFIDRPGAYSIMVRYNGPEPLQAGAVLAFDGHNPTVDGTQYVGAIKATAANADLAVGIASQRMKRIESDRPGKDGKTEGKDISWGVDQQATSFQPGDMIRVVVLGQVQVKVAGAQFGDRLSVASDGSFSKVAAGSDYIGRVISQPDQSGYVTLYVNLK